jgi:hypothetical protein
MIFVLVVAGAFFVREPRLERSEEFFLRWLLTNSGGHGPPAPLAVVEIGHDVSLDPDPKNSTPTRAGGSGVTPLEFALFLQSILDFQPTVVAFENVLRWRERDQDQEQVFIDQAMRVPRLLLASELTTTPDPDSPDLEITGFTHVTGKRGELIEFSGIGRQPNEDMRLIATTGFVNLPEEITDQIHVPLLFRYRGEVIPSFALQAILLWLRVTANEVTIDLGSHISLPHDRLIPIRADGTLLISPNVGKRVSHFTMDELLLASQQRDSGTKVLELEAIKDQIVLARMPANPLSPPDLFAATLATIQTNSYIRRVSWIFDCVILGLIAAAVGMFRQATRVELILGALAFTAAYCLIALAVLSNWLIWMPGVLPLGALWLLTLIFVLLPRQNPTPPEEKAAEVASTSS